jgi:hypothetical protein
VRPMAAASSTCARPTSFRTSHFIAKKNEERTID